MSITPLGAAATAQRYTYTPIIGLLPLDRIPNMHFKPMPITPMRQDAAPVGRVDVGSTIEVWL